jgi:hypothetical protein
MSGSIESALLGSCQTSEPPASAEDELWSRLKALQRIGAAAAAAGLATQTAVASTKATTKALWVALLKLGALVGVAGPALVVTAHVVSHRHDEPTILLDHAAPAVHGAVNAGADVPTLAGPSPGERSEPVASEPIPTDAPGRAAPGGSVVRGSRPKDGVTGNALSLLEAESRLVEAARARLVAGDPRGALDGIAHVAAQFPHGRLLQEKELVAIDSLAALDERRAMQSRARAFLERFPRGPYTQHVRRLLER